MIDDDFLRLQMGDKLRRIREDRGRGVDEVAAAAGIDGERLPRAHSMRDRAPGDVLQEFSEALPPAFALGGELS